MTIQANNLPDFITIEFLDTSGSPVRLIDLGSAFLSANGITTIDPVSPFRIAVSKQKSKAGNARNKPILIEGRGISRTH